jgi:hypothetical protein
MRLGTVRKITSVVRLAAAKARSLILFFAHLFELCALGVSVVFILIAVERLL